jgi:hypothetical protein
MQNRVVLEKFTPESPDKPVHRSVREGNLAVTWGLNNMVERLVTATAAFSNLTNGWVNAMAVGTVSTAPTFTGDALNSLTTKVVLQSTAEMSISDAGPRTVEYQGTFDDGGAYVIKEVGLFGNAAADQDMIAHSTLAATDQVNKGTADTVNISYQLIFDSKL